MQCISEDLRSWWYISGFMDDGSPSNLHRRQSPLLQ